MTTTTTTTPQVEFVQTLINGAPYFIPTYGWEFNVDTSMGTVYFLNPELDRVIYATPFYNDVEGILVEEDGTVLAVLPFEIPAD
ncbi:hypothetical protein RZS08_49440, partial [Arthrospira platensis SPKY1]|nr:hypothetical protein [Arthrospira platensis SPKY1]